MSIDPNAEAWLARAARDRVRTTTDGDDDWSRGGLTIRVTRPGRQGLRPAATADTRGQRRRQAEEAKQGEEACPKEQPVAQLQARSSTPTQRLDRARLACLTQRLPAFVDIYYHGS